MKYLACRVKPVANYLLDKEIRLAARLLFKGQLKRGRYLMLACLCSLDSDLCRLALIDRHHDGKYIHISKVLMAKQKLSPKKRNPRNVSDPKIS